jgi:hypothetical protein
MATIPGTQLAGVFRVRNKPEKFQRSGVALSIAGTADAVFLIHGTFIRQFRLIPMSEQATTKLIGLSVSAIFLMMLMLRAITS